ncbi:MAG: asparagine synthase (glutamine-hydrolyzing) [Bradyrhizobiaceae bacterium]|nr:asparagine synthase (glutamine-hydrolyzing) [Bradyrhizobiaceae bacterium]
MCGIVGTIGIPEIDASFRTLVDCLAHRGPDANGIFEERFAGQDIKLGHRRLSIIDLSDAANQPFEKDGLVLVYNGEVYNYRQLKSEIERSGVTFRTNSDTEVVLEAWRLWGAKSLLRLRGMFAFALYDRRSGSLVLARDPFGIKPLFVLSKGTGLAFASELKALLPILGADAAIDDTGVIASLVYGWLPDEFCMYRQITKLQPGRWLERRIDGTIAEHVYWDPVRETVEQQHLPLDIEELRHVLKESVEAHMVADVPVATFLSGGLDSSLITVLARRQVDNLDCFTIAFRPEDQKFEAMPDDLSYARQIAKAAAVNLHEVVIQPDLVKMLPQMVHILDEPIGDAAAINAYVICKGARDLGIKVLLSGMGADEIFAGYRRHYACMLAARYLQLPTFLRKGLIEPLTDALPAAGRNRGYQTLRWAKRFTKFASLPEEQAFHRSYALLGQDDLPSVLNRDFSREVERVFRHHAEVYAQGSPDDQVNRMCQADVRLFLSGLNLAYTDRASMAASTEVRVPFVDVEVVRAAFRIEGREKIHGRNGKLALKRAAEAWLPKSIVYRPKGLFSAPLRAWVRKDLREMVDDILPNGELVRRGYVKAGYIRNLIDSDRVGRHDYSKEIWHLLTLDYWLRNQKAAASRQILPTPAAANL